MASAILTTAVFAATPTRKLQTISAHTNTLGRAEALVAKGQWDEAIGVCDRLVAENSAHARPAMLLKAKCLEYSTRPEAALACYRAWLKEYPRVVDAEDVRMQALRISALELLQPEGILELDSFVKSKPTGEKARLANWWRAGVALKKRDWEAAKTLFAGFIKDYPNAPEKDKARDCLRECESKIAELTALDKQRAASIAAAQAAALKAADARETLVKLREGRAAMEKARFQEAIAAFQAVRKNGPSPDYEPALFELGRALELTGKPDGAIAVWNEALSKGTNMLWLDDCLLAKGRLLLEEKGQDKEAEKIFRDFLVLHPSSPLKSECYTRLGLSLLLQDRKLEAEAAFREAKKTRPPGPLNPWDELDRLLKVCAGDSSLWPEAVKMRPDAAARREILRADLLFALCDYAKARQLYERVAGESKDLETSARAWLQAGRCWNQLRRYEKALSCYERFLKSPYDNSQFADAALLRAGVIYVGPLGQSRKGRELYERILERYPDGAYAEMAELYICTLDFWAKDWKEALAKHETFVKRFPNSPNAGFVKRERLPVIRAALAARK